MFIFEVRDAVVDVVKVSIVESRVASSLFTKETDALAGPCVSES